MKPTCLIIILFACIIQTNAQKRIVGYVPQRSVHSITSETFKLITDAIYFGLDVDNNGVLQVDKSKHDLNYLDSLRQIHAADLSVCFGGWGRSDFFAPVTASDEKRAAFCRQVLDLCLSYQLKNIDLDWEFPENAKQLSAYVLLVQDLHQLLYPHEIGITVAVGHWEKQAKLVAQMEPYLAAVNMMLYDNVDPRKGHASYALVNKSVKRFMNHGIPAEKIVVGVPFYGRHRYVREKTMAYRQVPSLDRAISKNGLYDGYFFDTPQTLKPKIELIKKKKLGGIMIWELGHDVECTHEQSLLKYIATTLQ